jgi:Flp pilus assembly protein CpaB
VLSRRRPLAALLAVLAVLTGLRAARPAAAPTVEVLVAAHDLPSGAVLRPGDLVARRLPAGLAPAGTVAGAIGRTLAGPVEEGEPVTAVRLVGPSLLRGYPGRVVLPVRIADADAVDLLRVGDQVDLVAADPRRGTAFSVAVGVPVLSLPAQGRGTTADGTTGRLVVVAAEPSDVDRIAGAEATDLLTVVISG